MTSPFVPGVSGLFFAGMLASIAVGAATPTAAAIVTLTFNGVANDALVATDPCGCWGKDAYGADIVGDPFQAVFTFDTSVGTVSHSGAENNLNEAGVATGDITINGHLYDVTGSSMALYERDTLGLELVFYDDPSANTGMVVYVPANNPISNQFDQPVPFQVLNAANFAASGEDVVIPQGPGVLRAGINITSFSVTSVPEPASWTMLLLGFGGIGFAARRRSAPVVRRVAATG